ncbi:MAG: DUF2974 domain-containing protein [Lachnospiraceae bacterium]|nr:DUF2974 domain-containing protein [Lachnospiraceae bacterium]
MNTILSYLNFRKNISFRQSPFNDCDALLLAALSGLDLSEAVTEKMSLKLAWNKYVGLGSRDKNDDHLRDKEFILKTMADSIRYKNVKITDYTKDINFEEEKTFYGVTFDISPFLRCVAYRGTDGSLLSWKENYSTLYEMPTEGQTEASAYLSKQLTYKNPFKKCYVIGHSKGGNLAVYAAATQPDVYSKKIKTVFSFDSPGFINAIEEKESYGLIKDKIRAFVPVSCVIGNLMNPPYDRFVVNSGGKNLRQHDIFLWELDCTGFSFAPETDEFSKTLSAKMNNWINSIPLEERKNIVEELFSVFSKNDLEHISDLLHLDLKKILGIIMSAARLSPDAKEFIMIVLKEVKNM